MVERRKYPAESLTRAECLALLDACGTKPVGLRNQALIVLLWRSGLRLAEALALRERDIDRETLSIRVLHGKGDKARTVATDQAGLMVLDRWAEERRARNVPPGAPFICTMEGGEVWQSYVRALLPRLARKASVERRVHAHALRHTFAVELSRAGVPVRDIQQLLGHSSLSTTSIYLSSLSPEEALDRVRSRPDWRIA